jgi:hypothetical protein
MLLVTLCEVAAYRLSTSDPARVLGVEVQVTTFLATISHVDFNECRVFEQRILQQAG